VFNVTSEALVMIFSGFSSDDGDYYTVTHRFSRQ
jgi:hypothetical protein